jgi:hypothetical protein
MMKRAGNFLFMLPVLSGNLAGTQEFHYWTQKTRKVAGMDTCFQNTRWEAFQQTFSAIQKSGEIISITHGALTRKCRQCSSLPCIRDIKGT